MNIFFTCKNTLVILLQLYRLYVVQSENKRKSKQEIYKKYEIPGISIISRHNVHKDIKSEECIEDRKRRIAKKLIVEENVFDSDNSEKIFKNDSSPRDFMRNTR